MPFISKYTTIKSCIKHCSMLYYYTYGFVKFHSHICHVQFISVSISVNLKRFCFPLHWTYKTNRRKNEEREKIVVMLYTGFKAQLKELIFWTHKKADWRFIFVWWCSKLLFYKSFSCIQVEEKGKNEKERFQDLKRVNDVLNCMLLNVIMHSTLHIVAIIYRRYLCAHIVWYKLIYNLQV